MKIMMNVPKKLKMLLFVHILLVAWIFFQMGYRIDHQLSDIPEIGKQESMVAVVYQDLLTNHLLVEQIFNIFIIYLLAVVLYYIVVQSVLHVKLMRRIWRGYEAELSAAWTQRIQDEATEIMVVDEPAFIAMAFGFWKRRIVISTGALQRYSDEEIEAVLFHELYHCKAHHPLQTYLLDMLSKGLVFVPVIRDFARYYKIWIELLADRYAISRMNNEAPLASVLLSLAKSQQRMRVGNAVYFVNSAVNYRIEQLLNPDTDITVRMTNRVAVLISSLVLVFMMLFLFGYCL